MKNLPNILSVSRVLLVPVIAALFYIPGCPEWVIGIVFSLGAVTDFLDGKIARRKGLVTDFGKFVDPVADKLLVLSTMILLVHAGQVPAWFTVLVLARELAVDGLRMVAVGKGKVIPAGWSGKIKTFSQMTMIHFLLYLGWTVFSNWFITAGAVWVGLITLWSGVEYFLDNRDILRAQ